MHCHGIPGSRLELSHLSDDLDTAGITLVVPDRPGYGDTTPHPEYGFEQHSDDLRRLADHLGLERFCVSGFSGGGVFAMALAEAIGDRCARLAIAATPAVPLMEAPFEHASDLSAGAWQAAMDDSSALARDLRPLTLSADTMAQALLEAAGTSEARYLSRPPYAQGFAASLRAALTQGSDVAAAAIARDSALIADRWPFSPHHLTLPVRVIHGTDDRLVYQAHQDALVDHLPDAESCVVENAGHYAVLDTLWTSRRQASAPT